jgi:hypothetical protein
MQQQYNQHLHTMGTSNLWHFPIFKLCVGGVILKLILKKKNVQIRFMMDFCEPALLDQLRDYQVLKDIVIQEDSGNAGHGVYKASKNYQCT